MKDISYHILDIVQNSLNAGATLVTIELNEKISEGTLTLTIADNGEGMAHEKLHQVTDAFYTTSTTKKVGLGIPLLKQNAELTGGSLRIKSVLNKGTQVIAVFNKGSVDMIPMGDVAMTIRLLVASNPDVDFRYHYKRNREVFEMNTALIRKELGDISLNRTEVLDYISSQVSNSLKAMLAGTN